jgi:hypothetical protein
MIHLGDQCNCVTEDYLVISRISNGCPWHRSSVHLKTNNSTYGLNLQMMLHLHSVNSILYVAITQSHYVLVHCCHVVQTTVVVYLSYLDEDSS